MSSPVKLAKPRLSLLSLKRKERPAGESECPRIASLQLVATPTAKDAAARRPSSKASSPGWVPPLANILHSQHTSSSLEDDFALGEVIGEGAYAQVRLVKDRRSGELCACKIILKDRLMCPEDVEDVVKEVEILHLLSGCSHANTLRRTYEDRRAVYLVLNYCGGGELCEVIIREGTFSEARAACYFRQMVEFVHHCHAVGVIHRDIKLENFLLCGAGMECMQLQACDFGMATYFLPGQRFHELVGTSYYVAPEVLARDYGPECDLWSLGVVLYTLLSGSPPFTGCSEEEIFERIRQGEVDYLSHPWPSVSAEAKHVVQRLLVKDPAARATTLELFGHPWLAQQGVAPEKPLDGIVLSRMRTFAGSNKLKRAAVVAASKHLNLEQIEGLRHLFELFDTNGDGVISMGELQRGLHSMDSTTWLPEPELRQLMASVDADHSGGIDYSEFLAATVHWGLLLEEEVLMRAFRDLDTDGSGTLSCDEVAAAVGALDPGAVADVPALVREADTDGDGVISYPEFIAMLRGGAPELRRSANMRLRGAYAPAMCMQH